MIINKFILLRPHRVVTNRRHKSSGIKTVELALGWTPVKGVRGILILPWSTLRLKPYQQQLPMRHCSGLPLKLTSWFQPADDTGILPAIDCAGTLPVPFQTNQFSIRTQFSSIWPTDKTLSGARGVIVIVVGNGHGDTSSNPGRDWLHFT